MISFSKYLNIIDESNSDLLNSLANSFQLNIVFSKKPFVLTYDSFLRITEILDQFLFNSQIMSVLPKVKILTYNEICKELKTRFLKFCQDSTKPIFLPKNNFFGIFDVLIDNYDEVLKHNVNINYSHKLIILNLDHLKQVSFITNVAAICHELIHLYENEFNNGEEADRYAIRTNQDPNKYSHQIVGFIEKIKLAQSYGIDAVPYLKTRDKRTNKRAIRLMTKFLTPNELQLIKEVDINKKYQLIFVD